MSTTEIAPRPIRTAESGPDATTGWTTTCFYAHVTVTEMDRFIREAIAPAATALVDGGHAEAWFFLRYWHGGPHVRVRFLHPDPRALAEFESSAAAWLTRPDVAVHALDPGAFQGQFGTSDPEAWHAHGEVVRRDYEPEVARYGGPVGLALCEEFFEVSSRIAVAALALEDRSQVFALGLDFTVLAVRELHPGAALTSAIAARRAFVSWDFVDEASSERSAALRHAEALRPAIHRTWPDREVAIDEAVRDAPTSTHGMWTAALRELIAHLRQASRTEALDRPAESVVWSLIHMMHNRLGISVHEERVLSWLAAAVAGGWSGDVDYFADDEFAPDRRYLADSRYLVGAAGSVQMPRVEQKSDAAVAAVAAGQRQKWADDAARVVDLPAPDALSMALQRALERRCSGYGDYGGGMPVGDLSTVLGHAVGEVDARAVDTGIGRLIPRAHPSPGGRYATSVLVNAWDVEGLDSGLYRYEAHGHQLRSLGRAVSRSTFDEASATFGPPRPANALPTVVTASVPVTLLLVCDLARLRPKYGLRALRLLLQETGHVAQNIALCAAALGCPSLPVSAFSDDDLNTAVHVDGIDTFVSAVIPLGAGEHIPGT